MGWTEVAAELGTQAFLSGLKAAKGRVTKRQYKRLIATTAAQVLALHPDVGPKKARRQAERATGTAPSKKVMKGTGKGKAKVAAGLVATGALKAVASARGRKRPSPPRPGRAPARERREPAPPPEPGPPVSAGAETGV